MNVATSAARFVSTAVAFADNGRVVFESQGVVEGTIAPQPKGSNGFGYDPIFFYPPLGRTLGEVDDDTKAPSSHTRRRLPAVQGVFAGAQRIRLRQRRPPWMLRSTRSCGDMSLIPAFWMSRMNCASTPWMRNSTRRSCDTEP